MAGEEDRFGIFSVDWEYSEEASIGRLLKRTTGMGESRLAKVLPEESSIVAERDRMLMKTLAQT